MKKIHFFLFFLSLLSIQSLSASPVVDPVGGGGSSLSLETLTQKHLEKLRPVYERRCEIERDMMELLKATKKKIGIRFQNVPDNLRDSYAHYGSRIAHGVFLGAQYPMVMQEIKKLMLEEIPNGLNQTRLPKEAVSFWNWFRSAEFKGIREKHQALAPELKQIIERKERLEQAMRNKLDIFARQIEQKNNGLVDSSTTLIPKNKRAGHLVDANQEYRVTGMYYGTKPRKVENIRESLELQLKQQERKLYRSIWKKYRPENPEECLIANNLEYLLRDSCGFEIKSGYSVLDGSTIQDGQRIAS